jgi:hypothetical protein
LTRAATECGADVHRTGPGEPMGAER